jgi:hypothetical protein
MQFIKRISAFASLMAGLSFFLLFHSTASAQHSAWSATDSDRSTISNPVRLAAPAGSRKLGRLPVNQSLNVALTLKLRNESELDSLLEDLYNPSSPNYRHFLSVEEFAERFAPTPGDYERVLVFAHAKHLIVTATYANRMAVDVNGSVADLEQAFGVKLSTYQHPLESRTFLATDREPRLDPNLPLQSIVGLNTFYLPHPASELQASSIESSVLTSGTGGTGLNGSFTASDLRAAYIPEVSLDGSGESIGLFEMGAYRLSDIQGYFSAQGQAFSTPVVNVLLDGMNSNCGNNCDDSEQALDIEMALALAPKLSAVIVYEGSTPADILNRMVSDNLSRQLSCSYVFEPNPALYEPIFKEFAAQGQSFVASSGDGGAYSSPTCSSNCWTSRFPADDPYVTAVGGTQLLTASPGGAWDSETTWSMSGGGINSYNYAIPSYQAPLINASNQGSKTLRNIPDVAAVASNIFAEANGLRGSLGGTSASAPIWASFLALANQQSGGAPIGFLNPAVYQLAITKSYASEFHDITTGNNFNTYSPDLYSAVSGFDLVTGLGSPYGQSLLNALGTASSTGSFALAASAPDLSVAQGSEGSLNLSVNAKNGFNGSVSLRVNVLGQPSGVTAVLGENSLQPGQSTSVSITLSPAFAGSSLMVAIIGTSGAITQAVYLPVTVLLPELEEKAISLPPASLASDQTFSVTDTVTNSGATAAGASVTSYYLSDAPNASGLTYLLGSRSVPALAVNASSTATVKVNLPKTLWPGTSYYLLACANTTNSVAEAVTNQCLASSASSVFSTPKTVTATTLALSTSASISQGTVVTLTASVAAGTTAIHSGVVRFCDATAPYCTDSHLFGTAQLTASGTAKLRLIPGIGSHSYKAAFAGTVAYRSSVSETLPLKVTGHFSSSVALASSTQDDSSTFTATVAGFESNAVLSGTVNFIDTSKANASLGSMTLVAGKPVMNWLNAQNPAGGADPQGIAAADFNGDGILDLAVANRNDGTVSILLGKGDGTFLPAKVVSNVPSAQAIATGDFNGDGIADLAVTNSGYGGLTILLGKGDGSFAQAGSMLSAGNLPAALAVGDLNGDGFADIAVADYAYNTITVFLGNGDGTFSAAPAISVNGAPQGIAICDFNRDGKMDLAAAVASATNESVTILLGNGDGTFTTGASMPVGAYPSAIVAADFNRDGKADLAVTLAETNQIAVFLGNGDGTFKAMTTPPDTGSYPLALLATDINGDGWTDLVVANAGDSSLTFYLGNGDGTFSASKANVLPGSFPLSIVAGNFNGSGFASLATANETGNSASIFLNAWSQTATAALSGIKLAAGSHAIKATYAGNTNYATSSSTPITVLLEPRAIPDSR